MIKIGSRESKLAVIQSEMVIDAIKEYDSSLDVKLVTMKTTGDIILDKTLDKIGGKGLFVKELDKALMEERVDLTVHSLKDMPMDVSEELPLLCFSKGEDPRDVLILPEGACELDKTKPIGCSSQRRILQLKRIYPNMEFKSIRGNVQTRLKKLDEGEYSAIVLAYAGIKRLGLEHRVSRVFTVDEVIPAACQGILAVQGRKGYEVEFLKNFNHEPSEIRAKAERAFVRALDGGCSSPIAAYAVIDKDEITITGYYVSENGKEYTEKITGNKKYGASLGHELAVRVKERAKNEQ